MSDILLWCIGYVIVGITIASAYCGWTDDDDMLVIALIGMLWGVLGALLVVTIVAALIGAPFARGARFIRRKWFAPAQPSPSQDTTP